MQSHAPDLSVVIPVHNAQDTVADLVEDVLGTQHLTVQIVLVDDASTDGSSELVDQLQDDHAAVVAIHHDRNLGAGVARNTGFEQVTGRHTMFFDADDKPNVSTIEYAVRRLDATAADVAFARYRYQRANGSLDTEMNQFDAITWERIFRGGGTTRVVELQDEPALLGFSNYPWNKVIRTATYRERGLEFGHGKVHNDILGHWYTMLFADSIVLIDRDICTHMVRRSGHLTTNFSRSRFQLFDALDETYDLLEANPHLRQRYAHHYWGFALRTAEWAGRRLPDDLQIEFRSLLQQHVLRLHITDLAHIRLSRDPKLADRIRRAALS